MRVFPPIKEQKKAGYGENVLLWAIWIDDALSDFEDA